MLRLNRILSLLLIVVLFNSCKEDETAPTVLLAQQDIHIYVNQNEVISFDLTILSDVKIESLKITSKSESSFTTTLLDTLLNEKQVEFTFEHQMVPYENDTSLLFRFEVKDENGLKGSASRLIIFDDQAVLLAETTGHKIYSKPSGNADAFYISEGTSQFTNLADPAFLDIAEYRIDSLHSDTILTKSWYSPKGNKFVRFNEFDYANATDYSVESAYLAGNKLNLINNLLANDVLVTSYEINDETKYAVIKITQITDLIDTENDHYEFNLKKEE